MFQSDEYRRLSDLNLFRFGGGFELMKAGGDHGGLRALFQPFFRYASARGMLAVAYTLPGFAQSWGMSLIFCRFSSRLPEGRVRFNVFMHLAEKGSSSDCKWALIGKTCSITWYGLTTNLHLLHPGLKKPPTEW
jgi:hypothetical protein